MMCGRFIQTLPSAEICGLYSLRGTPLPPDRQPRYNGAPGQNFTACRVDEDGDRAIALLRWGLVPSWARDTMAAPRLINARAETLGLGAVDENELYAALDWLRERQAAIETRLAERHLPDGALVLYDLTSTWFEGRSCPLARHGYSRDRKRGTLQLVFGLLCDRQGWPLAVEAFAGNTAGLSWITALRAPAIRTLVQDGALQPSLFDERELAEISCEALYPNERLIVCRNPLLADERARKREDLLQATAAKLDTVVAATRRPKRRLSDAATIRARVERALRRHKMQKHFLIEITAEGLSYRRNQTGIDAEAALDGFYLIRTNVPAAQLDADQTVRAYKRLSVVERAFRSFKSVDLKVRPIHHRLATRVRAHLLLCLLAYYVQRHLRSRWAPLLFDDEQGPERTSGVAPAVASRSARAKAASKQTADGQPVHSFPTLLADLGTLAIQRVQPRTPAAPAFTMVTRPTPLQETALRLLNVRLHQTG